MSEQLRVCSYGGGVQSTALLVLAAQGTIDFKTFLFCNVGDDSEHPDTLRYVHEVAMPYAAEHGIDLQELQRIKRDGSVETLYGRIMRDGRSIPIPVRMGGSGAPGHRSCTIDFKMKLTERWVKKHGACAESPAMVALGISLDELQRARTDSAERPWEHLAYPLIDRRLRRSDCVAIIRASGLPIPHKSACYFCPYHSLKQWQDMRINEPDLFAKAVALERVLSDRGEALGRGVMFMTRKLKPLDMVTTDHTQGALFEEAMGDNCESGYCEMPGSDEEQS